MGVIGLYLCSMLSLFRHYGDYHCVPFSIPLATPVPICPALFMIKSGIAEL